MRRLHCFTLGFFLFSVQAEKEDFQGYHTEQTKGTTVTKDLLLKKENTIGHGKETIPTEDTHQHTAVAVTAKFPEAVLFDTRPMSSYDRTQITKALAIFGSGNVFVSRNEQTSLTSMRDNPSAMTIHTESEAPLISSYGKIAFSSTQAAFESGMNGTSEPEVYLSTDKVKASLWLHTLLDNRNQRNTDSTTLTSADRGSGVPILSASHPRVIDNLAVLRNDNDDKRSQGKDEKGILNLQRNEHPFGTVQSIFRSDTAEDSVSGNTLTNLCLTCQKDRRLVSTEKSVALPALSPGGPSDSFSTETLAFDFTQFTTSLPSSHQHSAGEQEEMLNKDISQQNITNASFGVKEQLFYNQTFPPLSLNKTMNQGQSILSNSQIKSLLSGTGTVAFDTQSLAEMSSATQKETKKQLRYTYPSETLVTERQISTTRALHRLSKSVYTVRKKETLGKKVSITDTQSKLIYFSKPNKNASHSLATNFKNVFVQSQPLDFRSGSVSKTADIAEAPHSSQKSVFQEGSDLRTATHPTARVIEAHSTIASFSLSSPTTSAVINPESHSVTGRADSLISVLRSQTPAKPISKSKEPILTLLQTDSGITFTSVTTKRHLTDEQDSQTFNTVNSIVKQHFVDPSGPAKEPVVKEPQTTLTTSKVVVPMKLILSESRRNFDDDVSTLILTTLSSKPLSERLTMSRVLGSQSKITQERKFDVSNNNHVAPTRQSFVKYNLIKDSLIVHNLKLGDRSEQVLTVATEDENKEIIKTEDKEIKQREEIVKLQGEEASREDEKLGNKRGEVFQSDKTESGKQEKTINTDREEEKMEEHEATASREEGRGTVSEEDVTLRQDKDPRQGQVRDGAEKKGVTKINTRTSTEDEMQRVPLTKEGEVTRREGVVSKEHINREIEREDMTNVPLGPISNVQERNRDEGHTVTNLSSCCSLIKQLGGPEHKGIHLGENIVEIKNKPFPYKVTSDHRPIHSTLRSHSPKLSRTSFPKVQNTQIKPRLSTHRATKHEATSTLTKESTPKKVVKATFSLTVTPKLFPKLFQAFGVYVSKFSDALEPTISPHSSVSKSAHPALKKIGNILSLTTPRLAITAKLLKVQPHITVNSPTLNLPVLYSITDHRLKFSTSLSKTKSLLQTSNEREQGEHIKPPHVFDFSVKDPLTSNVIEELNTSTLVNSIPTQQMYNDSSPRPPTAVAFSSVARTSILQPHPQQSGPQTSQPASSAFRMTSGKPCSFQLSEQTAHLDALHGPVDDNEQRSVPTLMASMSPRAENDQFPLSRMSQLPNLMLFGDDSLPGTYSLTGITRSASEKEVLRADSDAEYADSGSGHAELGAADETNQTEGNDSVQKMVTSGVNHPYEVTKQIAQSRGEKNTFPFIKQTTGRSKNNARNTEALKSFSILQTEKLAVKNADEDNHKYLLDGNDDVNNTVKTTLENNESQLVSYNKTSPEPVMSANQTTHKIEEFVPVTNDLTVPVLDTNDQTGTTAFVKSNRLPEIPQIQTNDVTNNALSDVDPHTAKTTEKQHDSSTPRGTVSDNAPPVPRVHFESDLKVPSISTQQTADRIIIVTSGFQKTTTKTNDFVSPAPTASASGLIVSTEAHESALTIGESVQVVTEKTSQAAHAERMAQSDSHIEPLSLRESPTTATTGKLPPAVKRRNTTETQSVEQPEREISVQAIQQNQHVPPGMIAITRPISDPGQSIQAALLKAAHRVGGTHDTPSTSGKRVEYSLFKDIKTTLTTKSAFEAKHALHEKTPTVRTLDRADQHKKHAFSEKTSISQLILGAVTDSVPPAVITPTEIINKTSCRTTGCANSGETSVTTIGAGEIDHTALEKMYKTEAGNTGGDHFNAAHTPDTKPKNGNCSTDFPLPAKATSLNSTALSPATSKSDDDHTTADETMTKNAKSMTEETSTRAWRVPVEADHLERHRELEQAQFVEKTTHSHRQTSKAQKAGATEVTLSEAEAATAQTAVKTTGWTLLSEKNIKTQLHTAAAKAEIFEAQKATRSARAVAEGETAVQESEHKLLLQEPEPESELPRLKHRRRTSPHLYLSGVTEVSDDLCGSGNYTAEMILNLGRGVEPGDAVPALGNLRVVINLKTNNSRINLEVTSCCLSPTTKPDLTNTTCCLFSRLAAEPAGITLLPSALSTSASFTISLFQMINYSVVYLHCDLSVCLRNRSDCERQCLQQRSAFPLEGPEAVVTNLRNRISFGPMLKEVKNSTSPEEMDLSELDLALVIVSLVVGSSLITVTLLLVWLVYRRRAFWLLHSAAPPRACCDCLHPGGDLILP